MVRHDMQAEKSRLSSEQIRLGLGFLLPSEREALAKAEAEAAERAAKEAAKGISLFDVEAP